MKGVEEYPFTTCDKINIDKEDGRFVEFGYEVKLLFSLDKKV